MNFKKENKNPFKPALWGLFLAVKTERNIRIHLAATCGALFLGAYLSISAQDWRWILLSIAMVWVAELFNSAIEALADKVEPLKDEQIKKIKDFSAAAVFLAALFALFVGGMVFYPYIENL